MKNRGVFHMAIILICFLATLPGSAQELDEDTLDIRKGKVKSLIAFLEFSLNTIGSQNTPAREKDIIITQSFNKMFRDEDVQVEDDLDLNRSTVTNKDIQAYLKDIDFFFRDVTFKLEIEEIEQMINDSSQVFYLVKLNRNLTGYTIGGDTVNQTITRFVEVNLDEVKDDLKIVSFYTTKLSEKEDLINWWDDLTFEWRYIFQSRFNLYDSVGHDELKALVAIDSLNISSNHYLDNFEPLFKLDQLKYLDLSHTKISDLSPLRIHNKLEHLNISETGIEKIDYLKYASNLRFLDISNTNVTDIGMLANFDKLHYLNISQCPLAGSLEMPLPTALKELIFTHAPMHDYSFIEPLINLEVLDLSFSDLSDLNQLGTKNRLKTLFIENTEVEHIDPLRTFNRLEVLNLEGTSVSELSPLSAVENLKKVFCDNSNVSKQHADKFMRENPGTLVIFDSEELRSWWIQLNQEWKNVFIHQFGISQNPEKDELASITQVDTMDISGNKDVVDLKGLEPLKSLKYLNIHDTYVRTINTLKILPEIQYLNASYSNITTIDSIIYLRNLVYLDIESTQISSIQSLTDLRALTYLNIERTKIEESKIIDFIGQNPECLVIYRSDYLENWWEGLASLWKNIFLDNAGMDTNPDRKALHKISYLKTLTIDSADIHGLHPLNELYFLSELNIHRTYITDIDPLRNNKALKRLSITETPISGLMPLAELRELVELDISNTGISDIDVLSNLDNLQVLKLSGIPIKKIKPLSNLYRLHTLDISSTNVRSLRSIEELYQLELLICYNTRLKERRVESFKSQHPDCKVVYY